MTTRTSGRARALAAHGLARRFTATSAFAFALPLSILASTCSSSGCVVRLGDQNGPEDNGAVTGSATDCSAIAPLSEAPDDTEAQASVTTPAIEFIGRFDTSDPVGPRFDWSGSTVRARFDGTEVRAGLVVPDGVDADFSFIAVIDDGAPMKFIVTPSQTSYVLAKDLAPGEHRVTLVRNSEALYGITQFTGFDFGGGALLPPNDGSNVNVSLTTGRRRRIEFIGDSITCGYGIEGENATCPYDVEVRPGVRVPLTENVYQAYGSRTARNLAADAVTVCFSGKGVIENYREPAGDKDATTTIPQYWERLLATVDAKPWDFAKEPEPDVVVVNLGTNDFSRDVDADTVSDGIDLAAFEAGYRNFLSLVRTRRPHARIFVAVPPMLTDTFPLDNARSNMRDILGRIVTRFAEAGDHKFYRVELVEMGTRYGLGCDYHPNLEVHRIMAEQLTGAIREKTCW